MSIEWRKPQTPEEIERAEYEQLMKQSIANFESVVKSGLNENGLTWTKDFRNYVESSGNNIKKVRKDKAQILLGVEIPNLDALKIIDEVLFENEQNSKG